MDVQCHVTRTNGERFTSTLRVRLDTGPEAEYYREGGIFHAVLRRLIKEEAHA
jgi:aconitase A